MIQINTVVCVSTLTTRVPHTSTGQRGAIQARVERVAGSIVAVAVVAARRTAGIGGDTEGGSRSCGCACVLVLGKGCYAWIPNTSCRFASCRFQFKYSCSLGQNTESNVDIGV